MNGFLFQSAEKFSEAIHLVGDLDAEGEVLLRRLVRKSTSNLSDINLATVMLDTYEKAKRNRKARVFAD